MNLSLIFVNHIQEKQAHLLPRLKQAVNTPEGVPRLFDLITVQDERIKPAFFAALGNTVVAKDIDQVLEKFFMNRISFDSCCGRNFTYCR